MYEYSHGDERQLKMMASYITYVLKIPTFLIKINHFLLFKESECIGLFKTISDNILPSDTSKNQPDIVILDGKKNIRLIIEVDGSSHFTKEGRPKTEKRNSRYKNANLPYIIINMNHKLPKHGVWKEKHTKRVESEKWTNIVEEALKNNPDLHPQNDNIKNKL